MQSVIVDYLPLVIFMALSLVIGGALLVAPFALAFKAPDSEKLSAYECGFKAFDDARMKFDIRFFWCRCYSSSSISKWRFFSHGPLLLKTSAYLVFGR